MHSCAYIIWGVSPPPPHRASRLTSGGLGTTGMESFTSFITRNMRINATGLVGTSLSVYLAGRLYYAKIDYEAGTVELNTLLEEARSERDASQKELGELRLKVAKELARASWLRGPSASRLRSALLPPASGPLAEEEKVKESAETPKPSQSQAQPPIMI